MKTVPVSTTAILGLIEGYSQPRRRLVFAQVRDRLPRPVNKPHTFVLLLIEHQGSECLVVDGAADESGG